MPAECGIPVAKPPVTPIYEEMPGWTETTYGARSWAELPANAVKYIRRVEELTGIPVAIAASTSPERDDTILVRDPFRGNQLIDWACARWASSNRHDVAVISSRLPWLSTACDSFSNARTFTHGHTRG